MNADLVEALSALGAEKLNEMAENFYTLAEQALDQRDSEFAEVFGQMAVTVIQALNRK